MKPILASDLMRGNSARNSANFPALANNRFSSLRDSSPLSTRSRSPSTKRKQIDESSSYAAAAKKRQTLSALSQKTPAPKPVLHSVTISSENLEILEINSAKVASICEKLHCSILAIPEENPVCPILRDFCEIIHAHNTSHNIIAAALRSSIPPPPPSQGSEAHPPETSDTCEGSESEMESDTGAQFNFVSLGALPKQRKLLPSARYSRSDWQPSQPSQSTPNPQLVQADRVRVPDLPDEILHFRECIKDAEKSTLLFNLDMGRVPIINQSTMGMKATEALTRMAAEVEGRPPSKPSADSVAVIDDVLSLATKVSIFGSSTKSVVMKGALSGSYCSVPVCYSFTDEKTRFRAEQALRARCKVSCATPYPTGVRDCIKSAIAAGKATNPDDFVRVKIDLPKLGLKLAWRAKNSNKWKLHEKLIPFPRAVLENPSKSFAGMLQLENLPSPVDHNDSTLMQNTHSGSDSSSFHSFRNSSKSPPPHF